MDIAGSNRQRPRVNGGPVQQKKYRSLRIRNSSVSGLELATCNKNLNNLEY